MKLIKDTDKKGKVMDCICEHEFQDKEYGKGKRFFNKGVKKYRCTVCSATRD